MQRVGGTINRLRVLEMCNWQDKNFSYARGRIQISANVIRDACEIIRRVATNRQTIIYSDLMEQLKQNGHEKINRGTIGHIVGEVSVQVSLITNPSIYPSSIVVRADTNKPGDGFWGIDTGTAPPENVPLEQRQYILQRYQRDVFDRPWNCNC